MGHATTGWSVCAGEEATSHLLDPQGEGHLPEGEPVGAHRSLNGHRDCEVHPGRTLDGPGE